jgi:hypothetical protein
MKLTSALALLFLTIASTHADDIPPGPPAPITLSLELPELVKGELGRVIRIQPKTPIKVVRYRSTSPDLLLLPTEILATKTDAVVIGIKPGRYRLEAWACLGEQLSDVVGVEIDIVEPAPIVPPTPPDESLLVRLQPAYTADQSPTKAKSKNTLIKLYLQMSQHCSDADITTAAQLVAVLRDAAKALLSPDDLKACRSILGEYLNASLPTDPTNQLTADSRRTMAALFNRVAKTLESIK